MCVFLFSPVSPPIGLHRHGNYFELDWLTPHTNTIKYSIQLLQFHSDRNLRAYCARAAAAPLFAFFAHKSAQSWQYMPSGQLSLNQPPSKFRIEANLRQPTKGSVRSVDVRAESKDRGVAQDRRSHFTHPTSLVVCLCQ